MSTAVRGFAALSGIRTSDDEIDEKADEDEEHNFWLQRKVADGSIPDAEATQAQSLLAHARGVPVASASQEPNVVALSRTNA